MRMMAVGAYGYGNLGDDLYIDVLKAKRPDVEWTARPPLVDCRPFLYDFTVVAGGGILYDQSSTGGKNSLRHYLRFPAAAR